MPSQALIEQLSKQKRTQDIISICSDAIENDTENITAKIIPRFLWKRLVFDPWTYATGTLIAALLIREIYREHSISTPLFIVVWLIGLYMLRRTVAIMLPKIRTNYLVAAPAPSVRKVLQSAEKEGGLIVFYSPTTPVPLGRRKALIRKIGTRTGLLAPITLVIIGVFYVLFAPAKYVSEQTIRVTQQPGETYEMQIQDLTWQRYILFLDLLILLSIAISTLAFLLLVIGSTTYLFRNPDPVNNAVAIASNIELLRREAEITEKTGTIPAVLHIIGPIDRPHGQSVIELLEDFGFSQSIMDITIIRLQAIGRGNFVPILVDEKAPSLLPTLISYALQTSGSLDEGRTHLLIPIEEASKREDPSPWEIKGVEEIFISTQAPLSWKWAKTTSPSRSVNPPSFIIPSAKTPTKYRLELANAVIEFFLGLISELSGIGTDIIQRQETEVIDEMSHVAKILLTLQDEIENQVEKAIEVAKVTARSLEIPSESVGTYIKTVKNDDSLEKKVLAMTFLSRFYPEHFEAFVKQAIIKKQQSIFWGFQDPYPGIIHEILEKGPKSLTCDESIKYPYYLFDRVNFLNPRALQDYLLAVSLSIYSEYYPLRAANFSKELLVLAKSPIIMDRCWLTLATIQPPSTLGSLLQDVYGLLEQGTLPRPVLRTLAEIAARASLSTFTILAQNILERQGNPNNHLPITEVLGEYIQNPKYRQRIISILHSYLSMGPCAESRNVAVRILAREEPSLIRSLLEQDRF